MMSGEEEDILVPDETVPVTTITTTAAPPTRMVSTMVIPQYQPLYLQVTKHRKTGAAFNWLMQDAFRDEEMGWEDCLAQLEGLQDRLVQAVEEAVLEIPSMAT
ncbi:UNVERIFIED_CONTAM: hypothetical protein K2H54_067581 [Gekko kuhli]